MPTLQYISRLPTPDSLLPTPYSLLYLSTNYLRWLSIVFPCIS
ncbi:hypothetical protein [Moorena sp. SIO3I6]|nr:hypothetical protein [Moorena sp. SIO3I6]